MIKWISGALVLSLFQTSVLSAEESVEQNSEVEEQAATKAAPETVEAASASSISGELAPATESTVPETTRPEEGRASSLEDTPQGESSSAEAPDDASPVPTAPQSNTSDSISDTKEKKKNPLLLKSRKHPKLVSVGLSAPLCGFAEGIITGSGWINTSSNFIWGNLDVRFLVRLTKRFAVGGGITQSVVYFDGTATVGGELVTDFRWYAVPDYLYFKLNLYFGFPLLFAFGPTIGHSFAITDKVHLYIENQFVLMVAVGAYGFWQPAVGAEIRF